MLPSAGSSEVSSFLSPAAFLKPDEIVSSNWLEHAPFALHLTEALKPANFVELSSNPGFSYFCFCQAVRKFDLPTFCFAAADWKADLSNGAENEAAHAEYLDKNRKFSDFSTLIQLAPNEAAHSFDDKSVDLLHIKLKVSQADLGAIFNNWLPKLSNQAIVLFHGTNVRNKTSSVSRFFESLKHRYPSCDFKHGNGLGMVAIGDIPERLSPFFNRDAAAGDAIRRVYARLGSHVTELWLKQNLEQKLAETEKALDRARAQTEQISQELLALRAESKAHDERLEGGRGSPRKREGDGQAVGASSPSELAETVQALAAAQREVEGLFAEVATLKASHKRTAVYAQQVERALAASEAGRRRAEVALAEAHAVQREVLAEAERAGNADNEQIAALHHALEASRQAEETTKAELDMIQSATFWRITRFFRQVLEPYPRTRRMMRKVATVAWWTVTLQLRERLQDRRTAQKFFQSTLVGSSQTSLSGAARDAAPSADGKAALVELFTQDLQDFLDTDETIDFPEHADPDVSVLIVLWNKAYFTLRCLRALKAASERLEIIIVDNGSSDETARLLSRVQGVRVITNEVNEGFLLATNRAASIATGRDLLLLNNDAFIRSGAISAAVETLNSADDIGAVGGRLILSDGRLQEAGSIIWSDGSTLGYLRGVDPEIGPAMFRRDVDYCSGALLLTPRAIWESLGGFDTAYAPAYYEEADYCLRLREAGLRTVYEPHSVADHFEFGSEEKRGSATTLSLRNRKVLRKKHRERLLMHHLPQAPSNILIASSATSSRRRRVLIIDDAAPLAALGAGLPRTKEIVLAAVSMGWFVTLYTTNQGKTDWEATRLEIPAEVEIITYGGPAGLAPFLAERGGYYEAVFVSRPHNVSALRRDGALAGLIQHGTRVIYDAEALFALRDTEQARVAGNPLSPAETNRLIQAESALCDGVDAVVCVSPMEASVFRENLTDTTIPVNVLSHAISERLETPDYQHRNGFLFVGRLLEKASPNWDGLSWFVRECWPLIREAMPEATLTVVGHINADNEELQQPGVFLKGPVGDLTPLYDAARVFVAPIRYAAGVPIKIIEASAAGLPCVGTRLLARQMNFIPGSDMIAENDPLTLAKHAVSLHEDPMLWNSIRKSASRRVGEDHSAERFRKSLGEILDGKIEVSRELVA